MTVLPIIIFFLSLICIGALFVLKRREAVSGGVFAPSLRDRLDVRALQLKALLAAAEADLERIPPELLHLTRIIVRAAALAAAKGARFFEIQLHRLADLVSHKHRFEARAPRSEFLKKVAEHKNGNGTSEVESTSSEQ